MVCEGSWFCFLQPAQSSCTNSTKYSLLLFQNLSAKITGMSESVLALQPARKITSRNKSNRFNYNTFFLCI